MSELKRHKKNSGNLWAVEMKRTQKLVNEPGLLNLSILQISKLLMHKCWHDYVKPKYEEKEKLWYIDTDNFIQIEGIHVNVMKDVKTRFITSDYKLERPLPIAQNEKVIELIKHELGGKIMTEFGAL